MGNHLFDAFRSRMPAAGRLLMEADDGRSISYGDMLARSAQLAHALLQLGVNAGDRVAVQVEKSPEAVLLYLACLRAGAVFLPLNTAYTLTELDYFFGDAEPRLVVCDPARATDIGALAETGGAVVATLGRNGEGSLTDRASRQPIGLPRRGARAGRSCGDPLHVGNDRPFEGRHAQPRKPCLERAGAGRPLALHQPQTC